MVLTYVLAAALRGLPPEVSGILAFFPNPEQLVPGAVFLVSLIGTAACRRRYLFRPHDLCRHLAERCRTALRSAIRALARRSLRFRAGSHVLVISSRWWPLLDNARLFEQVHIWPLAILLRPGQLSQASRCP